MATVRARRAARRAEAVQAIADILKSGHPPSPYYRESACRHGIRSALCLAGQSWPAADATAAQIVDAALARIGAIPRPTWYMGQPECTQPGVLRDERTACRHCGGAMPQGARIFCSYVCQLDSTNKVYDLALAAEREAARKAALVGRFAMTRRRRAA
jgi:hypothetical protein